MSRCRYLFYGIVTALGVCGFMVSLRSVSKVDPIMDPVARGRAVYISEGCIHCHSQYVRPVGGDQALWGECTSAEHALSQVPVLIGNRRQGPDLANVALRRSEGWNRLHLIEPAQLVPGSRMPSYRHLFDSESGAGEALLIYLETLKPATINTDKVSAKVKLGDLLL